MCLVKFRTMAFIGFLTLLSGGWLCSLSWAVQITAGDAKPEIVLPKDPKIVVLSYDPGANGFIRKGPPPYLKIQGNGLVTVTNVFDGSQKEAKLTAKQLEELVRFIVQEKDFFSLSEAKIADDVKIASKDGPFIALGGVGTSVIKVQTDKKQHEVSYRGASEYLKVYPKANVLARYVAVEKRLSELGEAVTKGK